MTLFKMPVDNPKLTSAYSQARKHPSLKGVIRKHAGVDLVNAKLSKAPIYATADGIVKLVKTTKDGYGKYIILTHSVGGQVYESVYAHLDSFSVAQGAKVKQGQKIGIMGNTGIGTGVHLHFELHRGAYLFENYTYPNSFDPWSWINPNQFEMRVAAPGLNLIKKWEGMYEKAYLCPANVWTIGYGLTKWPNGKPVKKGDKITQAEAAILLEQQVNEHASAIFNYANIDLAQNQFDALASFCYNLGANILSKDPALTRYINKRDWANVTRVMKLYNKASGEVLKGLSDRRKEEAMLFMKSVTTITKGVYDLSNITSKALLTETEAILASKAQRQMIIDAAVAAGANAEVWQKKLDDRTITEAEILALSAKALIFNAKAKS